MPEEETDLTIITLTQDTQTTLPAFEPPWRPATTDQHKKFIAAPVHYLLYHHRQTNT